MRRCRGVTGIAFAAVLGVVILQSTAGAQPAEPTTAAAARSESDVGALLRAGRFDDALGAIEGDSVDAVRQRAEIAYLTGTTDDAIPTLRAALERDDVPEIRVELARALVRVGRYDEARDVATPAAEADPPAIPALFWRARALERTGRPSRARLDDEAIYAEYRRGNVGAPGELLYVARALRHLERYSSANELFGEAQSAAPDSASVRRHWAVLFLEKYRPDEALELMQEARLHAPHDPFVLVMLGRAMHALDRLDAKPLELTERALAIHPRMPEALELRAEMSIVSEQLDDALAALETAAGFNPRRLETLTLIGVVQYLLDDEEGFEETEERILEMHPTYARFYDTVATYAAMSFRYREALRLARRALTTNANYWPALVNIGLGYSRAGDDERALDFFQRAFDNDPFNVRAFNMANLYETALQEYLFVEDPENDRLRYRFHQSERAILQAYVPDSMRSAWATYVERYDYEPEGPVSIEVFADPETFAVRSVGLPGVAPHGICFGHVVTSRSPSEGDFNWRMVLEHELSHVFTLQLSNYRVPRWFTEGLAEWDTIQSRPEWRREEDLAIVRALQRRGVHSVSELNAAFMNLADFAGVIAAYYQASLTVEYIAERWGNDALPTMLRTYAGGTRTREVLMQVLETSVEEFDAGFERFLHARYATMTDNYEPRPRDFADLEEAEEAVAATPDDAAATARYGAALLANGDSERGEQQLQAALALDPRQPLAHRLLLDLQLERGELGAAIEHGEAVLATGRDGYTLRLLLGQLRRASGDLDGAVAEYTAALDRLDRPVEAHAALADIALRRGDDASALHHLQAVVDDAQDAFDAAWRLAQILARSGAHERAQMAAERAANINPFQRDLHTLYARVAVANGDWTTARRELRLEAHLGPSDPSENRRLLEEVERREADSQGAAPPGDGLRTSEQPTPADPRREEPAGEE